MKTPRVSVVIPLYKGGQHVIKAIESVLAQTFTEYEIVIVDNNASDESRKHAYSFALRYPEKIRIILEKVQGVCSARNRGILEGRGELIALLDDDDVMYPDRLENQIDMYDSTPNVSIISCWDDSMTPNGDIISQNKIPGEIFWAKVLLGETEQYRHSPYIFCLPSTMLFSRNVSLKAGMFDTRFNPCGLEDMEFIFRMYELGPIKVVPRAGILYRFTEGAFEEMKWGELGVRSLVLWEKTNLLFSILKSRAYKNLNPNSIIKLNIISSQWLREFGCFLMKYPSKRDEAKQLLWRSMIARPLSLKSWKALLRTWYPSFLYSRAFHFDCNENFPDHFCLPENFERIWFETIARLP